MPASRAAATIASKSASLPRSGWSASWPPAAPPIAHGLPGIALARALGVVAPLAVRLADRVHGWQVDDVEAERGDVGQHRGNAAEAAPRAREELVPGAEAGALAVDVDPEHGALDRALALAVRERLRRERATRRRVPSPKSALPLGQLAAQVGLAGRDLAIVLVEPARVGIDPGLDRGAPRGRARPARCPASKWSFPRGSSGASRHRRVPTGRKRTTPSSLS